MGLAGGYTFTYLRPLITSLERSGFQGDLVLFVGEMEQETYQALEKTSAKLYYFDRTYPYIKSNELEKYIPEQTSYQPSPKILRYLFYNAYLKEYGANYDKVLIADTRDVIFQKDPFDYPFKEGLYCYLEDESERIRDNVYNSAWIRDAFSPADLEEIGDNLISCSGVTIGDVPSFLHYFKAMTEQLYITQEKGCQDQGVHNYVIYKGLLKDIPLHLVKDDKGAVSTISRFKPKTRIYINRKGLVTDSTGRIINIVHQYDRHPHLYRKHNFPAFVQHNINLLKRDILNIKKWIFSKK